MARNIFIVNAAVVDSNGTYNTLNNFPKRFDSESYEGDTGKALRRAKAAYHAALGDMYAVDNRQMQVCTLSQANGQIIMREYEGGFVPEPEPNEE